MKFFGNLPSNKKSGEYKQHIRVLNEIYRMLKELNIFAVVLSGINYEHYKEDVIYQDKSWDGEIDILLFTANSTVIYELKAKEIILEFGTTDLRKWRYYYKSNNNELIYQPFFKQASRQRTFFNSGLFEQFKDRWNIPEPNHFVIDSRLVLLPGSDYAKFYYKPPADYDMSKFEVNILDKISDVNDKEFMIKAYSKESKRPKMNKLMELPKEEYIKLFEIIEKYELKLKTANWFRIITENKINNDFKTIKNKIEEVNISNENLLKIPLDLNLDEIPIGEIIK